MVVAPFRVTLFCSFNMLAEDVLHSSASGFSYYYILASAAGLRPALNLVPAGGWLASLVFSITTIAFLTGLWPDLKLSLLDLSFSFSNENKKLLKVYQHLDCLRQWIMFNKGCCKKKGGFEFYNFGRSFNKENDRYPFSLSRLWKF